MKGDDIYHDLKTKSRSVAWHNDKRKERFILFSKSGFTQRMLEIAEREKVLLVYKDKVIR
jgi:hypothetical protein